MKKTGRNDPCPCGSAKKYKQCCLKIEEAQVALAIQAPAHGVARAIDWLRFKHPQGLHEALYEGFFGALNEEEMQSIEAFDDDTYHAIMTNAMEWVLAEGTFIHHDEEIRVSDLVLGRGGPIMTAPQRGWLEALRSTAMNLYEIIDVVPGESITFRDILHPEREPIEVIERLASQEAQPLDVLAARMVQEGEHHVMSGAIYPFHRDRVLYLMDEYQRETEHVPLDDPDEASAMLSLIIRDAWLYTLVTPFEMPQIIDSSTGAPVLFVTDHYQVKHWEVLDQLLAEEPDVEGSREEGWDRLQTDEEGMVRSLVSIDMGRQADRIRAFYRTQTHADDGKPWLEALLGDAVAHVGREISDPEGLLTHRAADGKGNDRSPPPLDALPPDILHQVLEDHLRKIYQDWADHPLPALADQTPREAIKTPEGLQKVTFLLRTYEHSEKAQALTQNRPVISYGFLWDSLGISDEGVKP